MAKRILLADDLADEPSARRRGSSVRAHALAFARRAGLSVDLFHVEDYSVEKIDDPYIGEYARKYVEAREDSVRRLAKAAKIRPVLGRGPVVPAILAKADARSRYELIAVGTHGRRWIGRAVLGSVAEEVIRNSRLPVFTVGPVAQGERPRLKGPILVATDLGKNSLRAESYAAALAKRLKTELVLVHCLYESMHPVLQTALASPKAVDRLQGVYQDARDAADRKLEAKRQRLAKRGVKATLLNDARNVDAQDTILAAAKQLLPSHIVLGTHGRNIFAGAFFGSTTRGTILAAKVPVITLRSRG